MNTIPENQKNVQKLIKPMPIGSSSHAHARSSITLTWIIKYHSDRSKEKMSSKLEMHVSSCIVHHFTRFFHQHHHHSRIYMNITIIFKIKEIESWPSWWAEPGTRATRLGNASNLLYNAQWSNWWWIGCSNTTESSSICNFHGTFKLCIWSKLTRLASNSRPNLLKYASWTWIKQ